MESPGPLDSDANLGSVNLEPFALRDAGPAPTFLPRFEGVFDRGWLSVPVRRGTRGHPLPGASTLLTVRSADLVGSDANHALTTSRGEVPGSPGTTPPAPLVTGRLCEIQHCGDPLDG